MDNTTKNVLVYMRISSVEQRNGLGIDIQKRSIYQYLESNGYSMNRVTEIVDSGVSAFSGSNISTSSMLGRFMDERSVNADSTEWVLIVYAFDRISRSGIWQSNAFISKFVVEGGTIVSVSTNRILNRNDSLVAIESTLAFDLANRESIRKSYDKKNSNAIKLERCLEKRKVDNKYHALNGSIKTPKFLDIVDGCYVLNDYSIVIRRIIDMFLSGYTSGYIVSQLSGHNFTTPMLLRMMKRENLFGRLRTTINGDKVIDNFYPAVCTIDDFNKVQSLIGKRKSVVTKIHNKKLVSVFSSLMFCSKCNCSIAINSSANTKNFYWHCTGKIRKKICHGVSTGNYTHLEKALVDYIFNFDFSSLFIGDNDNSTKKSELVLLENRYSELNSTIDNLIAGGIDVDIRMYTEISVLNKKIEDLKNELVNYSVPVFDFDKSSILSVDNVELRMKFKSQLSLVVKRILVKRMENNMVICAIHFVNSSVQYLTMNNKTGVVINTFDNNKIVGDINGEFTELFNK
ncbi:MULTISPECIES: recombinase family protein [unclassified Tatumella]|uniref:recombinase family protein n=1 Tax=unclassified Tatumella TaxID=2649542 RepID=UPI001BB023B6|nr:MULTISPECIES: recombinase family protein [unclassified Tatumella]MBS0876516.1 recombinase family protein [Tatumella sp. JGM82]MBS0889689.1 recombinase family protein [Tatumella sp. JGM94]MBS0900811.1 recombinase family protein [Tatumella sp. JGM100]